MFRIYEQFFITYMILAVVILSGYVIGMVLTRTALIRKRAVETIDEERKNL